MTAEVAALLMHTALIQKLVIVVDPGGVDIVNVNDD